MFPKRMYWIKKLEKESKGYEDKSSLYLQSKKVKVINSASMGDVDVHNKVAEMLKSFSSKMIESTTIVDINSITENMINESSKLLHSLYNCSDVNTFNIILKDLLSVCPRKFDRKNKKVSSLLAETSDDFRDIIQREEDLVAAMEGVYSGELFAGVYIATSAQKDNVLNKLDDSLVKKVKEIYRVIPKVAQKRFNAYIESNNISKIRQLWHGSRNENWFSIIKKGLSLNPNAKITGKMFGNGIYFAPSSKKSWGYTENGYWVGNSSQKVRIMGLYATAYGNPLDAYTSHHYTKSELGSKNCVHAHAGASLKNDEIIFYSEDAMVINYLVVFED